MVSAGRNINATNHEYDREPDAGMTVDHNTVHANWQLHTWQRPIWSKVCLVAPHYSGPVCYSGVCRLLMQLQCNREQPHKLQP